MPKQRNIEVNAQSGWTDRQLCSEFANGGWSGTTEVYFQQYAAMIVQMHRLFIADWHRQENNLRAFHTLICLFSYCSIDPIFSSSTLLPKSINHLIWPNTSLKRAALGKADKIMPLWCSEKSHLTDSTLIYNSHPCRRKYSFFKKNFFAFNDLDKLLHYSFSVRIFGQIASLGTTSQLT